MKCNSGERLSGGPGSSPNLENDRHLLQPLRAGNHFVSQTLVRTGFLGEMVNSPGPLVSALSISAIASIGGVPPKACLGAKVKIR